MSPEISVTTVVVRVRRKDTRVTSVLLGTVEKKYSCIASGVLNSARQAGGFSESRCSDSTTQQICSWIDEQDRPRSSSKNVQQSRPREGVPTCRITNAENRVCPDAIFSRSEPTVFNLV